MRNIKDLSDAEANRLAFDMAEVNSLVTVTVISIADKYGISRDEAMKHFIIVMASVTKFMSFEGYKTSGEVKHANRG